MGFREQLAQMKREYRREAVKQDDKIDQLAQRMDGGMAAVQERLGGVVEAIKMVQLQLQMTRDELAATNQAMGQVRADLSETARTMTGRSPLLEDRFGKMLDVVGDAIEADRQGVQSQLEQLSERVERLERDHPPAA